MDALHNLQSSGKRCPGHVARMEETRNEYSNQVRKIKGKRSFMRLGNSLEATVKMNPREKGYKFMIISRNRKPAPEVPLNI
jgi:hypothetical protein